MSKLLSKKRKQEEEPVNCEVILTEDDEPLFQSAAEGQAMARTPRRRKYNESYLTFGFTWCGNERIPKPKCLICGAELANAAMAPSKLKRHFLSKHGNFAGEPTEYFENLLKNYKQQGQNSTKKLKSEDCPPKTIDNDSESVSDKEGNSENGSKGNCTSQESANSSFKQALDFPMEHQENGDKQEMSSLEKSVTVSEKAQEASYLVAKLIAKDMKPHIIAESLILPSCCAIVRTMFGEEAEKEVRKIPLSNSTISKRIRTLAIFNEATVNETIKKNNLFALQLDISKETSNKPHLLAFVRYIDNDKIIEQFLCCKELPPVTKEMDIFYPLNSYLESIGLLWTSCAGICVDGILSKEDFIEGFISIIKDINPNLIITYCFLHRDTLITQTVGNELKEVLFDIIKMVNYIKVEGKKRESHLFTELCEEIGSMHVPILLHTQMRWLSIGQVLLRFHELLNDITTFFADDGDVKFCDLLSNDMWISKLSYLVDIFTLINKLHNSLKGKNENILSFYDKVKALLDKLDLWKRKVNEGNVEMFPTTADSENKLILLLIYDHLETLEKYIKNYLPNVCIENYDWVRNPFVNFHSNHLNLRLSEEEELADIRNDRTLKLKFSELPIEIFWIHYASEYENLSKKALSILIQFFNSHLCELGFATLVSLKSKKRTCLQIIEEEIRVCLNNLPEDVKEVCKFNQAQISH